MRTKINDKFPLMQLECQYYDVCRHYTPNLCDYSRPCPARLKFDSMGKCFSLNLRDIFRKSIEPYYPNENLRFQIELIREERNEDD